MDAKEVGPGRKDDAGKSRTDLIPAGPLCLVMHETSKRAKSWTESFLSDRQIVAKSLSLLTSYRATGEVGDLTRATATMLEITDLTTVGKVLAFGAKKYGENNWQKVEKGLDRYYSAAVRHGDAELDAVSDVPPPGRFELLDVDEESGLPHAAHYVTCCMFMLHLEAVAVEARFKDMREKITRRVKEMKIPIPGLPLITFDRGPGLDQH